jgi:hypothetical protein
MMNSPALIHFNGSRLSCSSPAHLSYLTPHTAGHRDGWEEQLMADREEQKWEREQNIRRAERAHDDPRSGVNLSSWLELREIIPTYHPQARRGTRGSD